MQASEDLHSDAEMEYASAEEVDFNEDANDSSGQGNTPQNLDHN